MPNIERTGWRDHELSARHRKWGDRLYGVDVDFLMVEYYARRAVMMVDYKHNVARSSVDENSASHQALAWLADGKSIPFVICIYNFDIEEPLIEVLPVNQTAKDYFGGPHILTEDWVRCQHHLRGLAQDKELKRVLESLKNEAPRTEN
ncbi:MAG: hypothetical protein VX003_05920 [SAR324 cluster bacterium]|nr:hypothetical protein [SAR324 cluster bacterium]